VQCVNIVQELSSESRYLDSITRVPRRLAPLATNL